MFWGLNVLMVMWNRRTCADYSPRVDTVEQTLFPQTTTEIATDGIRILFILYYSVYAIVLWVALGDQIDSAAAATLGYTDCSSLFGASTDLDNFIVFWKVTAVTAWVLLVVYCVLIVLVATAGPEERWRACRVDSREAQRRMGSATSFKSAKRGPK